MVMLGNNINISDFAAMAFVAATFAILFGIGFYMLGKRIVKRRKA